MCRGKRLAGAVSFACLGCVAASVGTGCVGPGPTPPFFWFECKGFGPATGKIPWVGSVLDHPPPTSSVGGQAPEGRLLVVAGKVVVVMVGGVGPGKGGDGFSMACCVCLFLFPALHSGRIGRSGNGSPLAGPVARRRRRFAVRPCVAGAPVAPAAVKNCKKNIWNTTAAVSLAGLIFAEGSSCVRLLFLRSAQV